MPRKLLLAEDSQTMQRVIAITFEHEDFAVTAVDSGEEALRRVRELQPDVVLADLTLPRMGGYELCEAIKQDPATRHIPVLLLAGGFEAFDEARARAAGATGHLMKPFETGALAERVRGIVGAPAPVAAVAAPPPPQPSQVRPVAPARPSAPLGTAPRPFPAPSPPVATPPQGYRPPPPRPPGSMPAPPPSQVRPFPLPPTPRAPAPPAAPPRPAAPDLRPAGTPGPAGAIPPRAPAPVAPLAPAASRTPGPGGALRPGIPASIRPAAPVGPAPVRPAAPAPMRPAAIAEEITLEVDVPRVVPNRAVAPASLAAPADGGEAALRAALSAASREVIERIAWEVVPQLAEVILREHVAKLHKP